MSPLSDEGPSTHHSRSERRRSRSRSRSRDNDGRRRRERSIERRRDRSWSRERDREKDRGRDRREEGSSRRAARSRSPRRRKSTSRSRSRSRSPVRDKRKARSRSHDRDSRRKRNRSRSRSVSSASSSDSDHRRKKRKHKKRSSRSRERKEKKEKKKDKKKKKSSHSSSHWGKYGIITDLDIFNKTAEFHAWLIEERKVNPETVSKDQNKKEFARFIEDYNTATLPHEKYYNMDAYEKRMSALRAGEYLPPADDSYDPNADMKALQGAHKRKAVEHDSYLSKEQLMQLRKVQNERVEVGRMKLLGMDVKQSFGVRMDGNAFEDGP